MNKKKLHTLSNVYEAEWNSEYSNYYCSEAKKYGRINRDKSISYNSRITTLFSEGDSHLFTCENDSDIETSFTVFSVTLKNGEFITKILAKNNHSRRGQYEVKGECVSKKLYDAFVGSLIRTSETDFPKKGEGWAVIR